MGVIENSALWVLIPTVEMRREQKYLCEQQLQNGAVHTGLLQVEPFTREPLVTLRTCLPIKGWVNMSQAVPWQTPTQTKWQAY